MKKDKKTYIIVVSIVILIIIIIGIIIKTTKNDNKSTNLLRLISTNADIEKVEEYKSKCEKLKYIDILRNANKVYGNNVNFKAEVFMKSIDEFGNEFYLLYTDIDKKTDIVYMTYPGVHDGEYSILEGDMIECYGIILGEKQFDSNAYPLINVQVVELYCN